MWNPDQTYMAERARRAELYTEAELRRATRAGQGEERLLAKLGRLLGKVGARLQGEVQATPHAAERL